MNITPIFFYRTATGNEPVREWLKGLDVSDRKILGSDLQTIQIGWATGYIVLLHGFIKKTQQTPNTEKALAKKRQKNLFKGRKS